jgi:ABC-type sugar transport system ATPase subunit
VARIDITGVVKDYGEGPALEDVRLSIANGETVSIVGSSGCGKSTLLKVVAGLEFPDSGTVRFDGQEVTYVRPQERGVGMVFQDYALYPSMKGKGNLSYYFQVHRLGKEESERQARETAERMGVGFEQLLGQSTSTLSGGEQQRVAIARCIVREPKLFLMDEPICNLDAKLRESTRVEMKKLLRKFGITALYVTHDQQEAIFMGDRIAVMRDGRIEQVGTFDELYYSPASLFVATFIGAPPMAVLPAVAEDGDLLLGGVRHAGAARGVTSGEVRLGVRPEGWRLGEGLPMKVSRVERLPTERCAFLHGTVAGTQVTVTAPLDQPEGDVLVGPDWERAYVFDGDQPIRVPGVPELF